MLTFQTHRDGKTHRAEHAREPGTGRCRLLAVFHSGIARASGCLGDAAFTPRLSPGR